MSQLEILLIKVNNSILCTIKLLVWTNMLKLDVEAFNKTCKMHEKRAFCLKHTTNYKVFECNFT